MPYVKFNWQRKTLSLPRFFGACCYIHKRSAPTRPSSPVRAREAKLTLELTTVGVVEAYLRKGDIRRALLNVGYGPIADIASD